LRLREVRGCVAARCPASGSKAAPRRTRGFNTSETRRSVSSVGEHSRRDRAVLRLFMETIHEPGEIRLERPEPRRSLLGVPIHRLQGARTHSDMMVSPHGPKRSGFLALSRHSKTNRRALPWEPRQGMLRTSIADRRCCGARAAHLAPSLVAGPKPTRGRPLPAGVESITPPTAVPKMPAALPDAEMNAVPPQVTPAVSAAKATVSTAKAAMSAYSSLPAPAAISSKRGRRHQQCADNRGSKREFACHRASPTGMTKPTHKLHGR
jgi:hypothetical protein